MEHNEHNLLEMRDGPQSFWTTALLEMSREEHACVQKGSPTDAGTAAKDELPIIHEGIHEKGQTHTSKLREVRKSGQSDSPPGLQQTANDKLALPDVSSGHPRSNVNRGTYSKADDLALRNCVGVA